MESVVRPRSDTPEAPLAKAPLPLKLAGRFPEPLAVTVCSASATVVMPRSLRSVADRCVTGLAPDRFGLRRIEPVTTTCSELSVPDAGWAGLVLSGLGSVGGEATGAIDVALTGVGAVCAVAGATPLNVRHPAAAAVENRRELRNQRYVPSERRHNLETA